MIRDCGIRSSGRCARPLPMLAIRHMVENDAPFTLRHPLLLPAYLGRFRSAAPRLLRAIGRRPRQA